MADSRMMTAFAGNPALAASTAPADLVVVDSTVVDSVVADSEAAADDDRLPGPIYEWRKQ
jgi:hypothetical protein